MSEIKIKLPIRLFKRCRGKTRIRHGFCDDCYHINKTYDKAVKTKYNKRDKKVTEKFYGLAKWKKFRARYVKEFPLCQVCIVKGKIRRVNVVDHIREIKDGGGLVDMDNVISMCYSCHNTKTNESRANRTSNQLHVVVKKYNNIKRISEGIRGGG